jgi:hypothetical protein
VNPANKKKLKAIKGFLKELKTTAGKRCHYLEHI